MLPFKRSLIIVSLSLTALTGGCTTSENRLTPNGQKVNIPQAQQFCDDNPGDPLCLPVQGSITFNSTREMRIVSSQ